MEQQMKRYVLAEKIALRSWLKVPYAYYHRDHEVEGGSRTTGAAEAAG